MSFSSSSFEPPLPPESLGRSIFPDVDMSSAVTTSALARNSEPSTVYVVTGSNRGIGFGFVQSLLNRTSGRIVACCRNPDDADDLSTLAGRYPERLYLTRLDLSDQLSVEETADFVSSKFGRVDVLLNVAGILGGVDDPGPERSLRAVDRTWAETSMSINAIGPLMFAAALAPIMTRVDPRKNAKVPSAVVVNVSARVGSISDNGLGGWYSYRMSKAALNMATRTMSHELLRRGAIAIALHPGTTETDLSAPYRSSVVSERIFPVDFTVGQLLDLVDRVKSDHTGGFYDWAGKALPF